MDPKTIQNVEWNSHSSSCQSLSIGEKRNISRYIHHFLSSEKMMFNLKYRYPHCKLLPDSTIDHVYFLTCINSRNPKTQRLVLLTTSLDKLHTSPQFCNIIVYHTDNYYNNDLLSDPPTTNTTLILEACVTHQTSIGWGHFIRGRLISSSTLSSINIIEQINEDDDSTLLYGIEPLSDYYGKCITKHGLNILILFMFGKN